MSQETEEAPDAEEVVGLIRAEGRNAAGLPGDIRDEAFCATGGTGIP